jgi:hypothetical protein
MSFGKLGAMGRGMGHLGALGRTGAWLPTYQAFRSYLASFDTDNSPHTKSAMASPPTIATTTSDLSATYPKSLVLATASDVTNSILIEGGIPALNATVFEQPYASTISSGVFQKVASRISVNVVNADVIALYVLGNAAAIRFLIDDQYVDFTGTVPAATSGTGSNYITITPGSPLTGKFTVELQQGSGLRRIQIKNTASFGTKPAAKAFRAIVLGDSFTAATGATAFGDGYVTVAWDNMGVSDAIPSGVGSTGYVNTASGTRYKLSQRLTDASAHGPFDIIDIAMGKNDLGLEGIQAEAETCFNSLRASFPRALFFVTGPWDSSAPSDPGADYATCKAAIQAAMAGRGGFWFHDPEGVSFTKSDATHPDTAGHATLAAWKVAQVRASMGLS